MFLRGTDFCCVVCMCVCVCVCEKSSVIFLRSCAKNHFGQPLGCLMAQWVKHLTLDFGSGHDLTVHGVHGVHGINPRVWQCADSAKPAWDSLSAPSLLTFSLSLSAKINKTGKNIFKRKRIFLVSSKSLALPFSSCPDSGKGSVLPDIVLTVLPVSPLFKSFIF